MLISAVLLLYSLNVVHADLKPGNVLLQQKAQPGERRGFTVKVSIAVHPALRCIRQSLVSYIHVYGECR